MIGLIIINFGLVALLAIILLALILGEVIPVITIWKRKPKKKD